ncbi:MAG: glycosyltransferase family 4 protein [Candidatus Doudnabacteria bacterium]|nr:glycosyltransferase family 4 protein [Candidatus Doudnabacteria bacterium]
MTIGIEAERANNPFKTGVEHYAKQLILHLAELDKENNYILYLRTRPETWFFELPKNFTVKVLPFPLFWTQLRLSWEMFWHPVDVLFIPASAMPLIHPKNSITTIHDLAWKFYPESFTWFNRNFLEFSTRFAVKTAKNIIAVSQSTKNDLVKFYKIPPEKITVVLHGYEESKHHEVFSGEGEIKNLPEKYVLFLSTLQPRKNLEGLIDAFALLKQEHPELPHKLVVVGRPGWKFESILDKINRHKDFVVYLNYLSDSDRLEVLAKAEILVQPSFYEGFGMQILEAFSLRVPVATSNVSSMPEVAAEAAMYFDPHNPKDIKNSLKMMLMDKSLRDSLIAKGSERLKGFSWRKCAQETLAVLKK